MDYKAKCKELAEKLLTVQLQSSLIHKEWKEMNDNLTATQTRCTELIQELRGLKNFKILQLSEIWAERVRQEQLRNDGKFPYTCATPNGLNEVEKLAVLSEEFGEVSQHVCKHAVPVSTFEPNGATGFDYYNHLREELIQVAAVCIAWVEAIDNRETTSVEIIVDLCKKCLHPRDVHLGEKGCTEEHGTSKVCLCMQFIEP